MNIKSFAKIFFFGLVLCLAFLIVQKGWLQHLTFATLKQQHADLREWTDIHFLYALFLYSLTYVLVTAFALPGAAVMTLAGGAFFGMVWGVAAVSLASTLGATLCFLGSRWLFRDYVVRRFGNTYEKVQKGLDNSGGFYLFTLRLTPMVPFFIVNLVFGLTRIRVSQFFLISQIGMLPATLTFVNAGTRLSEIESLAGIISLPIALSFLALGIFPWLAKGSLIMIERRKRYAAFTRPSRFEYDVAVIGAGAGGLVSAYVTAALKGTVALIEQSRMGGDCLYTGCVPSKTLLRSAQVAQLMRRGQEFGLQSIEPSVDLRSVFARIQRVIQKIEPHDSVERYTQLGVDCVHGRAFLRDPFRVQVGDRVITARNIIIATGASPVVPQIDGLDAVPYFTSENLWKMKQVPQRLLIIGGGPIGCELAQAFQRLGCAITLLERTPRLLSSEDEDVSSFVTDLLRSEGVEVITSSQVDAFQTASSSFRASLNGGQTIYFDAVILAVGRRANTQGFGLQELGISTRPDGTIETDEYLRTSYPNIFACGDVAGPFQFTHAASHQGSHAALNALFAPFKKFRIDYSSLPHCTYISPEVARVGLNEQGARARGVLFDTFKYDLGQLDRAICEGEERGFVKVLTAKGTGRLLGATVVGPHAGETIAEFVLALRKNLSLSDIMATVHSYPTFAEGNRFVAGIWQRSRAPQGILKILQRLHAWRRG